MLNPTGLGQILFELFLSDTHHIGVTVKQYRAARGCPLIDCKNVSRHRFSFPIAPTFGLGLDQIFRKLLGATFEFAVQFWLNHPQALDQQPRREILRTNFNRIGDAGLAW